MDEDLSLGSLTFNMTIRLFAVLCKKKKREKKKLVKSDLLAQDGERKQSMLSSIFAIMIFYP